MLSIIVARTGVQLSSPPPFLYLWGRSSVGRAAGLGSATIHSGKGQTFESSRLHNFTQRSVMKCLLLLFVLVFCISAQVRSFPDSLFLIKQHQLGLMTLPELNEVLSGKLTYREFRHQQDSIFGPPKPPKVKHVAQ
jgi:preprotein translocase subunit SecG